MITNFNYHSVIRMMGVLFLVLGISFVPTLAVALIYGEYAEALCFLETMVPCLIAGLVLMKKFSPTGLRMKARDGYLIVTLSWLVSSVVGAVPMVLTGAMPNPADASLRSAPAFRRPALLFCTTSRERRIRSSSGDPSPTGSAEWA